MSRGICGFTGQRWGRPLQGIPVRWIIPRPIRLDRFRAFLTREAVATAVKRDERHEFALIENPLAAVARPYLAEPTFDGPEGTTHGRRVSAVERDFRAGH